MQSHVDKQPHMLPLESDLKSQMNMHVLVESLRTCGKLTCPAGLETGIYFHAPLSSLMQILIKRKSLNGVNS